MTPRRIVVTGGRNYADRDAVFAALNRLHAKHPITTLAHGGARGADALAAEWAARRRGDPVTRELRETIGHACTKRREMMERHRLSRAREDERRRAALDELSATRRLLFDALRRRP